MMASAREMGMFRSLIALVHMSGVVVGMQSSIFADAFLATLFARVQMAQREARSECGATRMKSWFWKKLLIKIIHCSSCFYSSF